MCRNFLIKFLAMFFSAKFSSANTCSSYEAHIKHTSLQDKILSGHSFANFTGVKFGECSVLCGQTCRCRSFNLYVGTSGICELNDADKEEAPYALRVKMGFIHVSFRPLKSVSNSFCYEFAVTC